MSHDSIVKPMEAINKLISILSGESKPIDFEGNLHRLPLQDSNKEPRILLLLSGGITVHRRSDYLLFAVANAPFLFGLLGSPFRNNVYQFKAGKDAVVHTLSYERALELIAQNNAIRELLIYLSYANDYQSNRMNMLVNTTSQEIVISLLIELIRIPYEQRRKISVSTYIMERSNLARSGVMKILAQLRKNNVIETQNGKLLNVKTITPI